MFYETQPNYKFKRLAAIIIVIFNLIVLLSFLPLFTITLLAGLTTLSPSFDRLINVGIVITILFVLLLLVSILSLYQPVTRFRIRKEYKMNRHIYEDEYEIIADSEGINISIPDWRSSIGWKRIDRVYEFDEGFLIVYIRSVI